MTEPPQATMPAIWGPSDSDGFPLRHKPAMPFADIWISVCDEAVFEFGPVTVTLQRCQPCPQCYPHKDERSSES